MGRGELLSPVFRKSYQSPEEYLCLGDTQTNTVFISGGSRVTNCPGMTGTVPELQASVLRPGQKQLRTIKCPGIGNTALIMVKELS